MDKSVLDKNICVYERERICGLSQSAVLISNAGSQLFAFIYTYAPAPNLHVYDNVIPFLLYHLAVAESCLVSLVTPGVGLHFY